MVYSKDQAEVYRDAGFGGGILRGTRPAVLVVDFTYGFSDPSAFATGADMTREIACTRRVTDAARMQGAPVIYTAIAYHPGELDTLPWLRKSAGLKALVEGSRAVEIDHRTGIEPGDPVINKKGASAFFGTGLSGLLSSYRTDTLIVCGATTSGCVRASVVDGVQAGFDVLVPRDCCADRASAPHEANLYDMHQKYADVVDAADVVAWIYTLPHRDVQK